MRHRLQKTIKLANRAGLWTYAALSSRLVKSRGSEALVSAIISALLP